MEIMEGVVFRLFMTLGLVMLGYIGNMVVPQGYDVSEDFALPQGLGKGKNTSPLILFFSKTGSAVQISIRTLRERSVFF